MNANEIIRVANVSRRAAYYFLSGRGFSRTRSERLESTTGKHRLFWMYPGQYDEHGQPVAQGQGEPEEAA